MQFHSMRLADGRWGIYEERRLLATIGCSQLCQGILSALQQRQLNLPNEVPQMPADDRERAAPPENSRWAINLAPEPEK